MPMAKWARRCAQHGLFADSTRQVRNLGRGHREVPRRHRGFDRIGVLPTSPAGAFTRSTTRSSTSSRDHGHDAHEALQAHGSVSDAATWALSVIILACAAGHQGVKSAHRPAGDVMKAERKQACPPPPPHATAKRAGSVSHGIWMAAAQTRCLRPTGPTPILRNVTK